MRGSGARLVQVLALAVALVVPTSALAHDTYVDRSDGDDAADTNSCTHKATPCATLTRGLEQAGTGDTVFVGGDPLAFNAHQTLTDGKSIVHKNFSTSSSVDTSGKTTVDTGSNANPAIDVTGNAGQIKGLTIRSETLPLQINAKVTVTDDRFDEDAQIDKEVVVIGDSSPTISDNTFIDPTPDTGSGTNQFGISLGTSGSPKVEHNDFEDLEVAVYATLGSPRISKNHITGIHEAANAGDAIIVGTSASKPDIVANTIKAPGAGTTYGIVLDSAANLERNLIDGYRFGIRVDDAPGTTHLDGDVVLVAGDNDFGLDMFDGNPDDPKVGDVKATNITITGPGIEVEVTQTKLTLDSSLIGGSGIFNNAHGLGKCSISHSRGPDKGSGDAGCKGFSTTKNPKLKSDGYHLKSSSPMIDKGNPSKPGKGAKDIDGDKRALDGTGSCKGKKRRDIGADEFKC
jgi:hypothetical protein